MARMEQLRAWRQATGRTPMKRFSYVVECASHPLSTTCTPLHFPKHSFRAPSSAAKKCPSALRECENVPPSRREGESIKKKRSAAIKPLFTRGMECKETRRQMLEEWQAQNGRKLKRPPLFLKSTNNQTQSVRKKRRHTIGVGRGGEGGRLDSAQRELLKERLQREIAQEWAEEMEGGGDYDHSRGDGGQGEEHTPAGDGLPATPRRLANRREADGHAFRSTKVRFMLSEPRQRRRTCCVSPLKTVYVTPVRRSTREGRNQDGPGMKLDDRCCFDSPSEVSKHLEFDHLQILTNDMLRLE